MSSRPPPIRQSVEYGNIWFSDPLQHKRYNTLFARRFWMFYYVCVKCAFTTPEDQFLPPGGNAMDPSTMSIHRACRGRDAAYQALCPAAIIRQKH